MSTTAATPASSMTSAEILELHFFMRLAREWDLRFEKLFRTGGVAKWYSAVGNEAITVPSASLLEPGDALFTLHRDSGAILRYYLRASELFPDLPAATSRPGPPRPPSTELLYRLACQVLGKRDGFSKGYERSFHYGYIDDAAGIHHVGMISHLGAMIPVAAGAALAFRRRGQSRVALNFIGDGGTSTGDFHEGLNMAAVLMVPLVLVIENNGYAFSTPVREQFASAGLAERAAGYGIPGARVDGHDPEAVHRAIAAAFIRARAGAGPTLIEARVDRLRGHSEGDDSLLRVPEDELAAARARDPVERFEARITERGIAPPGHCDRVRAACAEIVLAAVDRAVAAPDPSPLSPSDAGARAVYAS